MDNGHKISEWEKAIKRRQDIEFKEIYLDKGFVKVVIGFVIQPTKSRANCSTNSKKRRVRWDKFGICRNVNGTPNDDLKQFNIKLI